MHGTNVMTRKRWLAGRATQYAALSEFRLRPFETLAVATFNRRVYNDLMIPSKVVARDSDLLVITEEPLAYVRRNFELRGIRLAGLPVKR